MIIVNYKTYLESTGDNALNLTKKLEAGASESNVPVIIAPQAIDVEKLIKSSKLSVWAQHVDVYDEGQSTGWFPVSVAKEIGVEGVLLNHSEHRLEKSVLQNIVTKCKEIGLKTLIFAGTEEEAVEVSQLEPDLVSYEPPELVGSKTTSVAEAKPETIQKVVEKVPNIPILVGAGVKSAEDVKVCLSLGAKGIAISSALVLAENPEEIMKELLSGF